MTTRTEHLATDEPVTLRLRDHHGQVRVRTVTPPAVRVSLDCLDEETLHACGVTLEHGTLVVDVPEAARRAGRGLTLNLGRRRFSFDGGEVPAVDIDVELPAGSSIDVSAHHGDVELAGDLDEVRVETGRGDVEVEAAQSLRVKTGSGDVEVRRCGTAEINTGSGDVQVVQSGRLSVLTGSGDVAVRRAGASLAANTGSGDIDVDDAVDGATLDLCTGSGDVMVRRMTSGQCRAMAASGDVTLAVAAGIPVWTDVTTTSGDVSSDLGSRGAPADGQPYASLAATSVSGDVTLRTA